jgi:hypothetical protein
VHDSARPPVNTRLTAMIPAFKLAAGSSFSPITGERAE